MNTLKKDEKIFSIRVDFSDTQEVIIAKNALIAREYFIQNIIDNIRYDIELIELTLEDMDEKESYRPLGEGGPTVKQLLKWNLNENQTHPRKDIEGQLLLWEM